jgi:hypothetical protein
MNKEINFTYGTNGKLPSKLGTTTLADALLVGAVSGSKNHDNGLQYATDDAGLEIVVGKSVDLVSHLQDGIYAISTILAYADVGEIEPHLSDIHWLLAGLADLSRQVNYEADEMRYALDKQA